MLVLTVNATILKPLFIQMYFTVYTLSIYSRFLSNSFQFVRSTHQKARINSSQKGKGRAFFTEFKLFSMWTDTNKTNHVLREMSGHWKRSSKFVQHSSHFYSWEKFKTSYNMPTPKLKKNPTVPQMDTSRFWHQQHFITCGFFIQYI